MVVDTSAVLAILLNEPDAEKFELALETDPVRLMSAASLLEAAIVMEARFGTAGGEELDSLLATTQIAIIPVTIEHVSAARQAFRSYGKGRHPASLNFGDCFSYALAKTTGEALLFKGNDFGQTDLTPWVLSAV